MKMVKFVNRMKSSEVKMVYEIQRMTFEYLIVEIMEVERDCKKMAEI